MKCRLMLMLTVVLTMLTVPVCLSAQEDDKKKEDERKTHKVEAGYFEVIETVKAIVESRSMTEVVAEMDNWSSLEIAKVQNEGVQVNAGDEIVWFDTEDIDKKIKETEYSLRLSNLALQASGIEMDLTEKTFNMDVSMNERNMQHMEQDFKYFTDVARPNQEKSTRRNVQNSEHSLEYSQEEYNQLKRMYDEDELTEESEEIVLKRTQRDVENRQFFLEQAQIRAAKTLEVDIPREADRKKIDLERTRLDYEKSKISMPLERDKKRVAYEKAKLSFENDQQEFTELKKDRERMTLKAPVAGVLYFGRCVRGKWLGSAGPNRDLPVGKSVSPNKTVVTIVDPTQLMLRAELAENQLGSLTVGTEGVATPGAFPKTKLTARVSKIDYVPFQADKFNCLIDLSSVPEGLMPGMTCNLRFVVARNPQAITVPSSALFTDDGISHYVFVVDGEGHRQQTVETGLTNDDKTEITSGLSAGVEILTERPE